MKKLFLALAMLASLATFANDGSETPAWQTTLGKGKNMWPDTGICSFLKPEAPAYLTGNTAAEDRAPKGEANRWGYWVTSEKQAKAIAEVTHHEFKVGDWVGGYFDDKGAFVPGHEVKTLFGMPYGLGQAIMIPIALSFSISRS